MSRSLFRSFKQTAAGLTRRDFFKTGSLLALPALLLGKRAVAAPAEAAAPAPAAPAMLGTLEIGPNLYKSIGVRPFINCTGTLTVNGGSLELPVVQTAQAEASQAHGAAGRAHARRRRPARGAHRRRIRHRRIRLRGGDDARDVRVHRRRQPGNARPSAEHGGDGQVGGHHPEGGAQQLRRGDSRHGRQDHRAPFGRGARSRHQSEDRDDLHPVRGAERPADQRRDLSHREGAQHSGADRRRAGNPHDPERAPAGRRDDGRLQRRQADPRTAVRRAAARTQGSRARGVGAQRAPSRLLAQHESRQGRSHRHAGGRRGLVRRQLHLPGAVAGNDRPDERHQGSRGDRARCDGHGPHPRGYGAVKSQPRRSP